MRTVHHPHGPSRHPLRKSLALVLTASLALAGAAGAQPTGNPKGTLTPQDKSAPKGKPSGAATRQGDGETGDGKLVGNEAQTRARIQGAAPPGGGTAGGLQQRDRNEATGGTARTDKGSAAARPLPPSR